MRIVITDSGLGGLSVCADFIRRLQDKPPKEDIEVLYINAVPEVHYGYNSMGSRQEKIDVFNCFLTIINAKYAPDKIYIACNSLSVIYRETTFAGQLPHRLGGIVETGTSLMATALKTEPDSAVIILATPTTIEENTYTANLVHQGIPGLRISAQACAGLANTISNDSSGLEVEELIDKYLGLALEKFERQYTKYILYLGCTHYGYRRDIFSEVADKKGINVVIINPNESASNDFYNFDKSAATENSTGVVSVEFLTRYPIPEQEIATITAFLTPISIETASALQNYRHIPDLF